MILGHSSPLNISSFAAATWGMFATGCNRTSLLLSSVAVLLQRDELQLEINHPFLRGGTELMSSASAVDTERAWKWSRKTARRDLGLWELKRPVWSVHVSRELIHGVGCEREWENTEVKLFTVSLSKKDKKRLERVTYYFQNNTWNNWTIKKVTWRLDLNRIRL